MNHEKEDFTENFLKWKQDICFSSSITEICNNRYYLAIIKKGKDVLPFIFEQMKKEPDFWFFALSEITGVNPQTEEHLGDIEATTKDWLDWGKENGYE